MNIVFFSASSSYVHTLLAPRYLVSNCPYPIDIIETNVNVKLEDNVNKILSFSPDIVCFSCYIFNIKYVREVVKTLKSLRPDITIIMGGYEVAFNTDYYLTYADYIIKGEGDFGFGLLIDDIVNKRFSYPQVIDFGTVNNLDDIISPYADEYLSLGENNHIIYMETSRGCPYSCSYCMSANTKRVRAFSLDRVKEDLARLLNYDIPLVKLVDRTFNYNVKRASEILSFIIDNFSDRNTRFHFEMSPELFNEELFTVISRAKKSLFQFEIGVQSYNEKTLEAVKRKAHASVIEYNISRLLSYGNVHIHVDLIAGLPYENLPSFIEGFDRLYLQKAHCLQLGFLKILKGSLIEKEDRDYVISPVPPYEIISSPDMSSDDLAKLKIVEKSLNQYANSGRFSRTMDYLIPKFFTPYEFFLALGNFIKNTDRYSVNFSSSRQCDALFEFLSTRLNESDLNEAEKLIYLDFVNAGNVRKWHKWLKIDG